MDFDNYNHLNTVVFVLDFVSFRFEENIGSIIIGIVLVDVDGKEVDVGMVDDW